MQGRRIPDSCRCVWTGASAIATFPARKILYESEISTGGHGGRPGVGQAKGLPTKRRAKKSYILKLTRETDPPAIHNAGWDFFTTDPGTVAEARCRVCGEVMAVERGVVGPTSLAHSLAIEAGVSRGSRHDVFCCEFSGEAWHRQALALKMESRKSPSKRVEQMLLEEAEQILQTRKS